MSVTIKTIAEMTGLSMTTVSKYLNGIKVTDKNKKAIEEAIKKTGYRMNYIAKSLKQNRTNSVGVIAPSFMDVFHMELFHYVEHYLREYGLGMQVAGSGGTLETEYSSIIKLLRNKVDAILLLPILGAHDNANIIINSETPLVIADQFIPDINADFVIFNNREISEFAVDRLIEKGHEKIAILSADLNYYTAHERYLGYENSLKKHGLPITSEYVCICSDFSPKIAREKAAALLRLPNPPTAIFPTSYYMTVGAIAALNDASLVIGKDISFIGYDSFFLNDIISPKLDSIHQPLDIAGKEIASLLYERISGKVYDHESKTVVIKSEYIEGKSIISLT